MWWMALASALANEPPVASEPAVADVDAAYAQALAFWQSGHYADAELLSREILRAEPNFRPAQLLLGYALIRSHQPEEAEILLKDLAAQPATNAFEWDIHQRAYESYHRLSDFKRRNQWALGAGFGAMWEHGFDGDWQTVGDGSFVFIAPLAPRFGVITEMSSPLTTQVFGVGGRAISPMFTVWQPVGSGQSQFSLSIGPSLWLARGVWWPQGHQEYLGIHADAAFDIRVGRHVGFRFDVGYSAHLTGRALEGFLRPVDASAEILWWFQNQPEPRQRRIR